MSGKSITCSGIIVTDFCEAHVETRTFAEE